MGKCLGFPGTESGPLTGSCDAIVYKGENKGFPHSVLPDLGNTAAQHKPIIRMIVRPDMEVTPPERLFSAAGFNPGGMGIFKEENRPWS